MALTPGAKFKIRTLLVVLVAVPSISALIFSVQWAQQLRDEEAAAADVSQDVDLLAALSRLQFGVQNDQLIGREASTAAETGIADPRTQAQAADTTTNNRAQVSETIDELRSQAPLLTSLMGDDVVEQLDTLEATLERIWADPTAPEVPELERQSRNLVTDMADRAKRATESDAAEVLDTMFQLGALQQSLTDEAALIVEALTSPEVTPEVGVGMEREIGRQQAVFENLQSALSNDQAERVLTAVSVPEIDLIRDAIATASGVEDRGVTFAQAFATNPVPAMEDRFLTIPEVRDEFAAASIAEARDVASDATSKLRLALLVILGLGLLTFLLAILMIQSLGRNLRSLAEHAMRIGAGEVDAPPVKMKGRSEIVSVSNAFDDVTVLLRTLDHQLDALGDGRTDDPALEESLPGKIGADLKRSVEHLSTTTEQLTTSEAMSSAIVDAAVDSIWTVDEDHIIQLTNDSAADLLGLERDAMVGRSLGEIFPSLSSELRANPGAMLNREVRIPLPDHEVISALVSAREVVDAHDDRLLTVFLRDISDRTRLEEKLLYQALHDDLTGLPNRGALVRHLDDMIATLQDGAGVAVLFLDLDRFKNINDALGHEAGDRLLVEASQRLQQALRVRDFVGRMGGDEFVVVLADVASIEEAKSTADRIRAALAEPFDLGAPEASVVEVSIGLAWAEHRGVAGADMLREADIAMYRAKDGGRARVEVFDQEMQSWAQQRNEIEQGLRQALAAGDVVGYVQPIIDIANGKISGGEMLARWKYDGEWVSPGLFIPIAEDAGLINELGRAMLHQACKLIAAWSEQGRDLRLTVNISGRHIVGGDVVADVRGALAATGAPADLLTLEITESFLLGDPEVSIAVLEQLRALGPQLLVDDFGTGYSSLTYLQQLPVSGIKLDQSFVSPLEDPGADTSIVRTVAELARSLGLSLVAEGVETQTQLERLISLGYYYGQGWLWSPALAPDEFIEWVDGEDTLEKGLTGPDAEAYAEVVGAWATRV